MVRSMLAATLIMGVVAEESLMQFEKSSDYTSNARFASAQKAVDGYQKLLQKMVNSGSMIEPGTAKRWLPTASFLEDLKAQWTSMETSLKEEQSKNQGILDNHEAAVKKCNQDRANAFAGADGVIAKMQAMQNARNTHSQCRDTEDEQIETMETDCGTFQTLSSECHAGPDPDQNWFASDAAASGSGKKLRAIIDQAKTCKSSVATVTATAVQCDGDQAAFSTAFCAYESALTTTCNTLETCYTLASGNKDQADNAIKVLERDQKILWRMVQKVHCFLDNLIEAAKTDTPPTQDTINTCNGHDYTTDADDEISITYEAAEAKDECESNAAVAAERATPSFRPGQQDWYNTELSSMAEHGKLDSVAACQ